MTSQVMDEFLPEGYQFSSLTILKTLGSGGFANTYLASNDQNEKVVLKELYPRGIVLRHNDYTVYVDPHNKENEEFWQGSIEGFHDEIRVLGALQHQSIPHLLDAFQANSTYYFVQDFIDGNSLEDLVNSFQQLNYADQVTFSNEILWTLLDILAELHENGVLHRDIKPANIIIRSDNNAPVLIDFGGVRFQVGGVTDTTFYKRVGSPGYCSWEQATIGVEQDESSDIYALAATMYKLLFAQEPPDSTQRLKKEDIASQFISLAAVGYQDIFLQSLDRAYMVEREDRFQSATEWLEMIQTPSSTKVAPELIWLIGRDPDDIVIDTAPGQTKAVLKKYIDGEFQSRLHLQVNYYGDYFELKNHSANGSWLLNEDGSKEEITTVVTITEIDVKVELAGLVYLLSDFMEELQE